MAQPITLATATPADAFELALRDEDQQAFAKFDRALGGLNQTLELCIKFCPDSVTARNLQGQVVAIFGVRYEPGRAHPWLACSDWVTDHKRFALRYGRLLVGKLAHALSADRLLICTYIGKDSPSAHRFARAIGFSVVPAPSGEHDFIFLPAGHV